jgi:RNA polymerase sigma factor (TIGR02999 family)
MMEPISIDANAPATAEQLFPLLYRELHRLAHRQLQRNAPRAALSATTLLHEAYLDLSKGTAKFPDRGQFFMYAARAMRGLIVDHVRGRCAAKRGAEFFVTTLDAEIDEPIPEPQETRRLNEALLELARVDPPLAELVDLKFFCGLTFGQIAEVRGVGERSVQREWAKARLLLLDLLRAD